MFSIKSRLASSPILWQLKARLGIQQPGWSLFTATTDQNTQPENEENTYSFGKLSSGPRFQHSYRRHEFKGDTVKSLDKTLPSGSNHSSPALTAAFQPTNEDVLEKWHKFKEEEFEKILRKSENLLEDDSEEEYRFFKNENEKDSSYKTSHNTHPDGVDGTKKELGNVGQVDVKNLNTFGKINPPKIEFDEAEGDEGDAREEKFEKSRLENRRHPQFYGNQMKKLCKERKLTEALKILEEEMPSVGAKPDDFCFNVLISECGRAGYTKKAFQLYNNMKKRALKPKHITYMGLFNACANSPWPLTDGLTRATKLRAQMIEKGVIVNGPMSHAMIKAFGRCGDISTAFEIVDDMVEQGILVTTETLNFLLQASISNQEAGFRHALFVWRKMRELKLAPDIYSYNLLIRCTKECRGGDPELTSQLLQDPKQHLKSLQAKDRTQQELKSYNEEANTVGDMEKPECTDSKAKSRDETLAQDQMKEELTVEVMSQKETRLELRKEPVTPVLPNLLGKKLKPGRVVALTSLDEPEDRLALLGGPWGFIQQMKRDKVKPDLRTVMQMLDCLPSDTQAEDALLQLMKKIGLVPDTQFCNMIIRKRNFRKDTEAAKEVLDVMQEFHLAPDLITFGCLASGCFRLRDATTLLQDMDAAGFRPNVEIMTSLIRNSLVNSDYYHTLEMLCEMRDRNIVPDDHLLKILEVARKKARGIILKVENDDSPKINPRKLQGMRLFLLEYKGWLKGSSVQQPDHPWAQYREATHSSN